MLTGYWPPSNEMLRKFSTDPNQNPGGWQGENWEGRGYNIYAYFPEFPGGAGSNPKGDGDFEVDYQDVASDFERITSDIHPVAILGYGKGQGPWEIEYNARNLSVWNSDYLEPTNPTPAPPDGSIPIGGIRNCTLPAQAIAEAINSSGAGVNAWVDWDGNPGAFLCEYMTYRNTWYQSLHSDPCDQYRCLAAGFTHVSGSLSVSTATTLCDIALRSVIDYLDSQLTSYTISGTITSGGTGLDGVTMNGLTGNPVTDANGFYTAKVGSGFSGTIAPIKQGYKFDPPELTYNDVTTEKPLQNCTAFPAEPQTIEFDESSYYSSSAASKTFSWPHTIGSGDNRALIVTAVCGDNLAVDQLISSVKYNDVNMTKLPGAGKSRGYIKADLYYMLEADLPSLPGSYTLSMTYNGNISIWAGGAVSLENVKQQIPEAVATNSSNPDNSISTDINTFSNGAWIVNVVGHSNSGSFSSSTSDELWDEDTGILTVACSTSLAETAGSTSVSWDFSDGNDAMVHSLTALAPAQITIPAYTLTASSTDGGNVTAPGEGAFQYDDSTVVGIVALPEANYQFVNWTGSGITLGNVADPNSADTTINVDENYVICASFERLAWDDFNDTSRKAIWRAFADDYENVALVEDANRLNLTATGEAGYLIADYVANGWSLDVANDFTSKIDFHYSGVGSQDGWVGIAIEKDYGNYVSISAGSDGSGPYLRYEMVSDGNQVFDQKLRDSNDGTLYISYDAGMDELYLSTVGYGAENAWQTLSNLLQGQWVSEAVSLAIGGGSDGDLIDNSQAYLDNFEITAAVLSGWPVATDFNKDGFIDWLDVKAMSEHWLESGSGIEGDSNGDGIVDFEDFAALADGW